jgi:hypothetical protein
MRKNLKPVIHQGRIIKDYFISIRGIIYSNKTGKLKKISIHQYKNAKSLQYPHAVIMENNKPIVVRIHRILGEVFLKFPRPKHIPYKVWSKTSIIIKRELRRSYVIDHINNNPSNYKLSNLRWVSSKQNSVNYHEVQKHLKRK